MPLWFFYSDTENVENTKRIIRNLRNYQVLESKLSKEFLALGMNYQKWIGCFGVQSYISLNFLEGIENKYRITNLINAIKSRSDRCCLERIMGAIFYKENPLLHRYPSIMGDILKNWNWGYTFDNYLDDVKKKQIKRIFVKVWTGR